MTNRNQLNIDVLLYGCVHHQYAWLMPDSAIKEVEESRYYQRLAQIAEAGGVDAVFFRTINPLQLIIRLIYLPFGGTL